MRLLLDLDEYYNYIIGLINDTTVSIDICTFGVYAGITYDAQDTVAWGAKYHLLTRDFLDSILPNIPVRILLGVTDYTSCKGNRITCYHCEKLYIQQLSRILNHAEKFNKFQWRINNKIPLRCVVVTDIEGTMNGVAGGRNLNDVSTTDASFAINDKLCKRLKSMYEPIWAESLDLNSLSINKWMTQQELSESTIARMSGE